MESVADQMVQRIDRSIAKNVSEGRIVFAKFAIQYVLQDETKPLVFTFDNMVSAKPMIETRSGWGVEFLRSQGFSCVSFLTTGRNWYRSREFRMVLNAFVNSSFDVARFPKRVAYGSSMGAYAAAAYGDLLGCEERLLIHPVSTLNSKLVPWETRNFTGRNCNWNSAYSDSVGGCVKASKVTILVDNLFDLDYRHAKRYLRNGNTRFLKCSGLGHGIPFHLLKMGVLKEIVVGIIEGNFEDARFHALMRGRRSVRRYYDWMLGDQNCHLTDKRRKVIHRWRIGTIEPWEYRVPAVLTRMVARLAVKRRRAVYRLYRKTLGKFLGSPRKRLM